MSAISLECIWVGKGQSWVRKGFMESGRCRLLTESCMGVTRRQEQRGAPGRGSNVSKEPEGWHNQHVADFSGAREKLRSEEARDVIEALQIAGSLWGWRAGENNNQTQSIGRSPRHLKEGEGGGGREGWDWWILGKPGPLRGSMGQLYPNHLWVWASVNEY